MWTQTPHLPQTSFHERGPLLIIWTVSFYSFINFRLLSLKVQPTGDYPCDFFLNLNTHPSKPGPFFFLLFLDSHTLNLSLWRCCFIRVRRFLRETDVHKLMRKELEERAY